MPCNINKYVERIIDAIEILSIIIIASKSSRYVYTLINNFALTLTTNPLSLPSRHGSLLPSPHGVPPQSNRSPQIKDVTNSFDDSGFLREFYNIIVDINC